MYKYEVIKTNKTRITSKTSMKREVQLHKMLRGNRSLGLLHPLLIRFTHMLGPTATRAPRVTQYIHVPLGFSECYFKFPICPASTCSLYHHFPFFWCVNMEKLWSLIDLITYFLQKLTVNPCM